eukprot:CAMPEP_0172446520 /NCGR_PEP_ID=MMETSP1065-20121228/6100_1 /TAXON_ID=265537 /ORGANISM="Amphiprora paludosa, Strain CCMP125" /LENGTH=251 /DNA_ID=CAMNT_0013197659 /DNA_START=861 /DNA_END=1616 /DNA_ORIENTATION=+
MYDSSSDEEEATVSQLAVDLRNTRQQLKEAQDLAQKAEHKIQLLKKELNDAKDKADASEREIKDLKAAAAIQIKDSEDEDEMNDHDDEESVVNPGDKWSIRFRELREYRIIHGDCNVSSSGPNRKLGVWARDQRTYYTNLKSARQNQQHRPKITQERIDKLERLEFSWGKKFPPPILWQDRWEELRKRQQALGNCHVPMESQDPSDLAKWVSAQRWEYHHFRKGRPSLLTPEKISMLKDIGFKFNGPRLRK